MKKLFPLLVLSIGAIALAGCGKKGSGNGGKKETPVEESEFAETAEKNLAKENPYHTASMNAKHLQKQDNIIAYNLKGTASYERQEGQWVATEQDVDSQYMQISNPVSFINFTMDMYATFVSKFRAMVGEFDKLNYTVDQTCKVVMEKSNFTYSSYNYKSISVVIEWDSYGQILNYDEEDHIDYSGYDIAITDQITYSYAE